MSDKKQFQMLPTLIKLFADIKELVDLRGSGKLVRSFGFLLLLLYKTATLISSSRRFSLVVFTLTYFIYKMLQANAPCKDIQQVTVYSAAGLLGMGFLRYALEHTSS